LGSQQQQPEQQQQLVAAAAADLVVHETLMTLPSGALRKRPSLVFQDHHGEID